MGNWTTLGRVGRHVRRCVWSWIVRSCHDGYHDDILGVFVTVGNGHGRHDVFD